MLLLLPLLLLLLKMLLLLQVLLLRVLLVLVLLLLPRAFVSFEWVSRRKEREGGLEKKDEGSN
jgi:hypothetical protein